MEDHVPEGLLESVEPTRRAFVRKLILGSSFVSPVVSSFTMGGLAFAQTGPIASPDPSPSPSSQIGSNTGGPIGSNVGPITSPAPAPSPSSPIGSNTGGPIGSNVGPITSPAPAPSPTSPIGSNTGGPIGSNLGPVPSPSPTSPIGSNTGGPIGSNLSSPAPAPVPAPGTSPSPGSGPDGGTVVDTPEPASALLLASGAALLGGGPLARRVRDHYATDPGEMGGGERPIARRSLLITLTALGIAACGVAGMALAAGGARNSPIIRLPAGGTATRGATPTPRCTSPPTF